MTTRPPLRYKDTWHEFDSMAEMAQTRVRNPSPRLGGTRCPALEFTLAVSEDGGANWRNATTAEREQLAQAIRDTGECCQKSMDTCSVRN